MLQKLIPYQETGRKGKRKGGRISRGFWYLMAREVKKHILSLISATGRKIACELSNRSRFHLAKNNIDYEVIEKSLGDL